HWRAPYRALSAPLSGVEGFQSDGDSRILGSREACHVGEAAVRGSDPPHARRSGIRDDMQQWHRRLPAMQGKSAPRELIALDHAAPLGWRGTERLGNFGDSLLRLEGALAAVGQANSFARLEMAQ